MKRSQANKVSNISVSLTAFVAGGGLGFALLSVSAFSTESSERATEVPNRAIHSSVKNSAGPTAEVREPALGESAYQEILHRFQQAGGDLSSAFSLVEWNLSGVEKMEALERLLAELQDQFGMDHSEAIACLAARLIQGDDDVALIALTGEATTDDSLLAKILSILESANPVHANRFKAAALAQLAVHDPAGGSRWIQTFNRDHTDRTGELGSPSLSALTLDFNSRVIAHLSRTSSSNALLLLDDFPADEEGVLLRRSYLDMLAKENPDTLWKIASNSTTIPEILHEAIGSISGTSPSTAAKRLLESDFSREDRLGLEQLVLQRWAEQSPKAAFSSVVEQRDLWQTPGLMTTLFTTWAARDSLEASSAIAGMAPGPDRDDAIIGLIPTIMTTNKEIAVEWMEQIGDRLKREELFSKYPDS